MIHLPPSHEPAELNDNAILYWNHVGLEMNRIAHSVGGPHTGPTLSSRVLGILQLAVHDAYFAVEPAPGWSTYLTDGDPDPAYRLPSLGGADDARQAVAGAAVTVLEAHYALSHVGSSFPLGTRNTLEGSLRALIAGFPGLDALSASYRFGIEVGRRMVDLLAVGPLEPGADQGAYRPKSGRYKFRDEPGTPVRFVPLDPNDPDGPRRAVHVYHAPFYGMTARRFAVQMEVGGAPTEHIIADPPVGFGTNDGAEYDDAVRDVIAMGGAFEERGTLRNPDQTTGAFFWAYDGANLIGTPPRLYNGILRRIAWERRDKENPKANDADFARLLALANAAMADAGIFAWQEKYCFEFWRPLTGVREHDASCGPEGIGGVSHLHALANPFWCSLGAPETNTHHVTFKPPFPAYPSGHATFCAAAFGIARSYYRDRDGLDFDPEGADAIAFDYVSDELDGVSRDLREPYDPARPITEQLGTVRTRVVRHFPSLWAAIFENAMSRIWLGVHWRFDAYAASDVLVRKSAGEIGPPYATRADGTTAYKDPVEIRYETTGPRADRPGEAFPIGGVPLGLGIARDIYEGGLRPTPKERQPTGRDKCGVPGAGATPPSGVPPEETVMERRVDVVPKATQTNIR